MAYISDAHGAVGAPGFTLSAGLREGVKYLAIGVFAGGLSVMAALATAQNAPGMFDECFGGAAQGCAAIARE